MSKNELSKYAEANDGDRKKTVFLPNGHLGKNIVANLFKNLAHKIKLRSAKLCTNHLLRGLMITELSKFLKFFITNDFLFLII